MKKAVETQAIQARPFGYEIILGTGPDYGGSILRFDPDKREDHHYHTHRDETVYVQSGVVEVVFEKERVTLGPGESCRIPPLTIHRLRAVGQGAQVFVFHNGKEA